MISLTPVQVQALDLSRNLSVTAAAGSGKTRVLVERYLWAVEDVGFRIGRVVAITFTEKAAGEMSERVRDAVEARARSGEASSLAWSRLREDLPRARISTIHGFCSSLLREDPLRAGVDPGFQVLDSQGQSSLLAELFPLFFQEVLHPDQGSSEMRALLKRFPDRRALEAVLRTLLEGRGTSLAWARALVENQESPASAENLWELESRAHRVRMASWGERMAWLLTRRERTRVHRKRLEEARPLDGVVDRSAMGRILPQVRALLAAVLDGPFDSRPAAVLELARALESLPSSPSLTKAWDSTDGQRALDSLRELATVLVEEKPPPPPEPLIEEQGLVASRALARLFLRFHTTYREALERERALDFQDLQEKASLLLGEDEASREVSSHLDHLLIDEFQDTDSLQWSVLKRALSGGDVLPGKGLFIVGDEKQSIYGFRGARVEVLGQVRRALHEANRREGSERALPRLPRGREGGAHPAPRPDSLEMAENFRSTPDVVAFINGLMAGQMPEHSLTWPVEAPFQAMIPMRDKSGRPTPPVEILLPEEDGAVEMDLLARRLHRLLGGEEASLRPRDIGILLRRRLHQPALESALRKLGIPFQTTSGLGFFQRREVLDLSCTLSWLADADDAVALAGVLRSPLLGLSDEAMLWLAGPPGARGSFPSRFGAQVRALSQDGAPPCPLHPLEQRRILEGARLLHRWKRLAHAVPLPELVERIAEEGGLRASLASGPRGEQDLANLDKLVDLARSFGTHGYRSLADFSRHLQWLSKKEEREGEADLPDPHQDAVAILTIHASKGLQWKVVALPDLGASRVSSTPPVRVGSLTGPGGEAIPTVSFDLPRRRGERDRPRPLAGHLLANEEKRRETAESLRLFYVALTRAEDKLILSGVRASPSSRSSWMALVEDGVGDFSGGSVARFPGVSGPIPLLRAMDLEGVMPAPPPPTSPVMAPLLEGRFPPVKEDLAAAIRRSLSPLPPGPGTVSLSPSVISEARTCPRKTYYRRILEIPEARNSDTPSSRLALLRGSFAHLVLQRQEPDEELPSLAWALLHGEGGVPPEGAVDSLVEAGRRARTARVLSGLAQKEEGARRWAERPFTLRLGRASLTGRIDLLLHHPVQGAWTIVDYKTDHITSLEMKPRAEEAGHVVQMQAYALAVRRLMAKNQESITASLLFTTPGVLMEGIPVGEDILDALEGEIRQLGETMTKSDPPPLPLRAPCHLCGYWKSVCTGTATHFDI